MGILFFVAPRCRKVGVCHHEKEDPIETHRLVSSSPPTPHSFLFFFYLLTLVTYLSLWGGMMSQARLGFPCPPEIGRFPNWI